MGLMYLSSPLIFGFFAWYPNLRRRCITIGLIIMCLSLGLSSLSQTVSHLIASQGVFYAIGGALCYSPVVAFMDEWFVNRKGLAFGIMWVCLHSLTSIVSCHPLSKRACTFSTSADSVTGWHWYRWHNNSITTAIPLG
jgi:MFS family permease